ncbi:MAG: HAD-IA family hydrolase [Candidatus Omnitrophota bacterium]|nr:HAD-IA family hydrolase [Candidatus Omnitrophota bacterium]
MNHKVIVFDFDGVIVESNGIKHDAFSSIFRRYPKYYKTMMSFHYEHNHLPRQDKFRYLVKELMGKTDCEDDVASLTYEFEGLTRQRIISCPYVAGARECIDYFSDRLPLYIVSATPEAELMIILEARDMIKKFKGVYGPPMTKSHAFKTIIGQEQVAAFQVLFVGDSIEDYSVAKEAGIYFVARKTKENSFDAHIPICNNLSELKDLILDGSKPAWR